MSLRELLHWLAVIGAAAAVVAYFAALLRRPTWVRIVNGSGLLFTGLALAQAAVLAGEVRGALSGVTELMITALLLAVAAQGWSGLRNRRAWDGVERRAA
ncbi:MAG: hypothetical protein INR64_10765 [Caulobacteraceae bacterium]|nr:hypothetical protein [Caulobacter sp.]